MIRPKREVLSEKNLLLIGIPKKFHDISVEDIYSNSDSRREMKEYICAYVSDIAHQYAKGHGLILLGSNGVGKTFISCLIAKEAYRSRYSVRRVTFLDYISEYTRVWGAKNAEERETIEANLYNNYKAVEFLILEEVGKEIDSKVSAPILEDLLRYREDHGHVTIICTNTTKGNLSEKYGASVMSLIEGNMTPIQIVGADKRKSVFDTRVEE